MRLIDDLAADPHGQHDPTQAARPTDRLWMSESSSEKKFGEDFPGLPEGP